MEVTDSDKRSILLQLGINYDRKMFYSSIQYVNVHWPQKVLITAVKNSQFFNP
jgi:hypothetical protein